MLGENGCTVVKLLFLILRKPYTLDRPMFLIRTKDCPTRRKRISAAGKKIVSFNQFFGLNEEYSLSYLWFRLSQHE